MEFIGKLNELFLIDTINNGNCKNVLSKNNDTLTILWSKNTKTKLKIDNVDYLLENNQMVFLTEFHYVDISEITTLHIIKFNRNFYCIGNHDSEIGCKGVLFFGASQVPIISLNQENFAKFELLWTVILSELQNKDELQLEMLQMLLKRFLIISTRIFKENNFPSKLSNSKLDVIRDYNYLVEIHFKSKHSVGEYATLMHRPAKSLSNLFAQLNSNSPLQILQSRILLEAKRILIYSNKNIKETAFELGFDDVQSFSRFFKNKEGASPKEFREKIK
jgi:AraC family transcriptional regulator, transcriptional activator of pobA